MGALQVFWGWGTKCCFIEQQFMTGFCLFEHLSFERLYLHLPRCPYFSHWHVPSSEVKPKKQEIGDHCLKMLSRLSYMWAEGVTLENVAKVWETSQAGLSVLEQHIHHQKEASALASIVHIPTRLPQQKQKCCSPAWWIEEATMAGRVCAGCLRTEAQNWKGISIVSL